MPQEVDDVTAEVVCRTGRVAGGPVGPVGAGCALEEGGLVSLGEGGLAAQGDLVGHGGVRGDQ